MNYTVVFYTHSGALKFNRRMEKLNIPCALQPVPRRLSSSCGVCAKISYDGEIEDLLGDEILSIYSEVCKNKYELVYKHHIN